MRQAQDLRQLGRDHDDRLALGGQRVDQPVDLGLRADVDAARRLVEEQDVAIAQQPLRDHDLLLVAARQQLDRLRDRGRADTQLAHVALGRPGDRRRVHEHAQAQQPRQRGHGDVGLHVHRRREPELLAVFRQVADAQRHGVARRADARGTAVDQDLAAVDRVGAEHGARDLRAPGAHQPGEAEDLALAHAEADVADRRAAPQVAHVQRDVAGRRVRRRAAQVLFQRAAHHHVDDRGHARVPHRHGGYRAAVAHHGDAVGDLLQLVHPVRDVDDAHAVAAQLADDAEQVGDFLRVQGGRRLVHDQHPGVERQRLRDLHHLLARHRQVGHRRARVEIEVQALEQPARVGVQALLVQEQAQAAPRLAADVDVLRGAQVPHQVELLVDDADAQRLRAARAADLGRLAGDLDHARVARMDAGQHLHQRGLARAVLAHERMDLAGTQIEVDLVQRLDAGEALAQAAEGDERVHLRRAHRNAARCRAAPARARGRRAGPAAHRSRRSSRRSRRPA